MAALTTAARRQKRNVHLTQTEEYAVATSTTVYQGGLVALNKSTGRAVPASNAASRSFLGMAEETATGNTAGTVKVKVSWGYEALLDIVSTQVTEMSLRVGANAFCSTDNDVTTATNAGTAGVRVSAGEITAVDTSDSTAWIHLRRDARDDA